MTVPHDLRHVNRLLAAVPESDHLRWQDRLEHVELLRGQVVYEAGESPTHVVFPCHAVVSVRQVLLNGSSTEIAQVGREGLIGIAVFMGGVSNPCRAVVVSPGLACSLPAAVLKETFDHSPAVMGLVLRYIQAAITQMAQTAVCNRHHTLDQQLCRWLLLSLDRLDGMELAVTQDLIATTLGVRREGVTEAALRLQAAGLIRYRRGHITVLDRPGLEQRSCECYRVVRREYERLLPATPLTA
ncbi:Crp/Fnr family transcriptional regulator [Leptothrix discophora]|uniref:Crp/Fnr family transcriptional regulator n=1 Tax=Leptothrix discophora TaxID=89 RepID=A0ABT9G905_LEPDI|nr:Crp/Fnr family transcriptional regulator [Leptothrix discophora]MDP4302792.1 Crp/Fnr family transcriptional regulator [Leptothrix discophora]